jgi:predicted lactoylglutathione lyase
MVAFCNLDRHHNARAIRRDRGETDMSRMIFVNLPVADLDKAKAFYAAIGFTNEPRFTDETAACMVLSETIHVMLLTHAKWKSFTTRPIPSPTAAKCRSA